MPNIQVADPYRFAFAQPGDSITNGLANLAAAVYQGQLIRLQVQEQERARADALAQRIADRESDRKARLEQMQLEHQFRREHQVQEHQNRLMELGIKEGTKKAKPDTLDPYTKKEVEGRVLEQMVQNHGATRDPNTGKITIPPGNWGYYTDRMREELGELGFDLHGKAIDRPAQPAAPPANQSAAESSRPPHLTWGQIYTKMTGKPAEQSPLVTGIIPPADTLPATPPPAVPPPTVPPAAVPPPTASGQPPATTTPKQSPKAAAQKSQDQTDLTWAKTAGGVTAAGGGALFGLSKLLPAAEAAIPTAEAAAGAGWTVAGKLARIGARNTPAVVLANKAYSMVSHLWENPGAGSLNPKVGREVVKGYLTGDITSQTPFIIKNVYRMGDQGYNPIAWYFGNDKPSAFQAKYDYLIKTGLPPDKARERANTIVNSQEFDKNPAELIVENANTLRSAIRLDKELYAEVYKEMAKKYQDVKILADQVVPFLTQKTNEYVEALAVKLRDAAMVGTPAADKIVRRTLAENYRNILKGEGVMPYVSYSASGGYQRSAGNVSTMDDPDQATESLKIRDLPKDVRADQRAPEIIKKEREQAARNWLKQNIFSR